MHGKIVYIQNGLIILVSIAFYLKCEYKLEHYFISYCSSTDMRITIPLPSTTPRIAPGIGPCDNFKTTSDISLNSHPNDCDKFVQCYFDEKGQLWSADQQCPFGQYWDQDTLKCRSSKYVKCEKGFYSMFICLYTRTSFHKAKLFLYSR